MLIAYLSERGLHSSDRFLYNYIINLTTLLAKYRRRMIGKLYMMHCVYVCVLCSVPTDIQKSNNVKLVQSSVPLGLHESDAFALPPPLNVVTVVVDTRLLCQFQLTAWVRS